MSPIKIHTLPALPTSGQEGSATLRSQIEEGLLGSDQATVPGDQEEDKAWAFKRRVPTVVLYDEAGLRLYDNITAHAHEYYLFPDELNLLKNHGPAIARCMGFPGGQQKQQQEEQREDESGFVEEKRWRMARWGDSEVGKWNGGVNGEEGLGSGAGAGWEKGWDVVELGAGALRKTAHLLTALSGALPTAPANAASLPAPITYHPLDLSRPELHRVLGEMDEAFGQELKGKVDCIGLHGDYDAGLQFIRAGKLGTLRSSSKDRGRALGLDGLTISSSANGRTASSSSSSERDAAAAPGIPLVEVAADGSKPTEVARTPSTARSGSTNSTSAIEPVFSPGSVEDSPLSEISSSGSSTADPDGDDDAGTWSPVASDLPTPPYSAAGDPDLPIETAATTPAAPSGESTRPLHFMFLGSSLGNFEREQAAPFLRGLPLKQGDTLLIGLDGRPAPGPEGNKKVEVAYNDPAGYTRAFEEHGWDVVRQELGLKDDAGVEFVGRYNEVIGRHEAYFRSKAEQTIHLPGANTDVTLEDGELLNIEWSYKYSYTEALTLFNNADLRVVNSWKAPDSEYRLWLLERPHVRFNQPINADTTTTQDNMITKEIEAPLAGSATAGKVVEGMKGVPKWTEWLDMWKLWDHITLEMIPQEMLHQKPIDLRHICLFYLGHIPTFLDIYLTRLTNGEHSEPRRFKDIFERGIDPDVDDPNKCHDHSEVPVEEADWPYLDEILLFRNRVRHRLLDIYTKLDSGEMDFSRRAGRVLFMTFEHEAMHAETLLYMLLQSPLTRAPTAAAQPQWDVLAAKWRSQAQGNKVLAIPAGVVQMGHVDLEADDEKYPTKDGWGSHEFGWDIEHPCVTQDVKAFKIDALPISNEEYMQYLRDKGADLSQEAKDALPASWVFDESAKDWKVRSLYGPVPFSAAGRWPLMASRNEIEAFAKWKGGRLPTEPEIRMMWESEDGPRPAGLDANVGFKNWHPVPPTLTVNDNDGQKLYGHNGGVWEWTSTPLEGFEGYVTSELYPGYSSDFFDGKHSVVLGGSYATVPQLAGRKSFRNWYQANYRFSFIGGRVAYDA